MAKKTDVLIIGCGSAGCAAALALAARGISVTMLSAASNPEHSNSYFAQGGVIYRAEDDTPALLSQDILKAGAGLSLPQAVGQLVAEGPGCVERLIKELQVPFDRMADGSLSLTKEAAHSKARIVHHRDHTGKVLMESFLAKVKQTPQIELLTSHVAIDLITLAHHSKNCTDIYQPATCVGAYVFKSDTGAVEEIYAKETILATGGIGEVFLHTTNPKGARGDGLAMAYRAGVRVMNMEYIQFHPTSFYVPNQPRFLLTEALRGEGAELLTVGGHPFMKEYHPLGSLAPRDVVARAIYSELLKSRHDHVWLDISSRPAPWLKERFPNIYAHCLKMGFDLTKEPVPIVPAAHYCCGGVAVDTFGQTTMRRLRAIGEVACTGLHGANRIASSSLLECMIWGTKAAESIAETLPGSSYYFPPIDPWAMGTEVVDSALIEQDWLTIKQTMWNYVGLVRDERRLRRALKMLEELKSEIQSFYETARLTPDLIGLRNGIETALLITQGAARNRVSLGCHYIVLNT